MELVNIVLESELEKARLVYEVPDKKCRRTGCEINKAIKYFLSIIKKLIKLEESTFYMVIRDSTLFTFKYDKGNISLVENNFYTYSKELTSKDCNFSNITGICFTINDEMSISIRPKPGYRVSVRSDNSKYY
ncbi:MPPV-127 virion core protein [Magpiepox virus 2]|nr:virion core protein [Magpiepox virus]QZW33421.1 MPPV-127 virion core protein [Magpiepox virus 2]